MLINPPIRENEPPRHLPIGLGIIAKTLLNDGHEVNILDINAERISKSDLNIRLNFKNKYDVIGVGGLITTHKYLKWLIPEIKKHNSDSKIVIGGGVVTENPTPLLSKTPADVAVIGEGENTIKELILKFEENDPLKDINGIAYKEESKIKINPPRPLIKDLDDLPFPAYELFPMDIYLKNVSHASIIGKKTEMDIITSRGCPYNCKYCYHIFGIGVRSRSVDNVIEEIKYLIDKYKIDSLLMLDETFTIDKKRVNEFCTKLSSEKIDISWSCYARVNLVDREMLDNMRSTGCFRVGYGIESGSQTILDKMEKRVTVEQAKNAIKITREAGLICGMTWMFGYPGETLETLKETIDLCKEMLIFPSFFYTTPYPGSWLYDQVKDKIVEKYGNEENFISVLGNASDFTINLTDFSDEQLHKLKRDTEEMLRKIPIYRYPEYLYSRYQQYGMGLLIKRAINKII